MNKIDWQAYLDGSLPQEKMMEAEKLLQENPDAQSELAGLQSFREQIKEQSLQEPIPTESLEKSLQNIVGSTSSQSSQLLKWSWIPAAAAITFLLVVFLGGLTAQPPTMDLRKSPFVAKSEVHDSKKAAEWVVNNLHSPSAPMISLTSIGGELDEVSCGSCWMAYKFHFEDKIYTIYGREEADPFKSMKPYKTSDKDFFMVKDGIGWRCKNNMTYVVTGGTKAGRLEVARAACQTTPNHYQ